jgi:hypothetical protein
MYKSYIGSRLLSRGEHAFNLGIKRILEALVDEAVMKKFNFQLKQILLLKEF